MEIMFDKCLKDLLAKHKRTQHELAEHLSISTQAVSKWCRGENLPDITLLPKIASFLDVSVDELLGVGEIRKQEKIQEYRERSYELSRKGLAVENIGLWHEAYNEFPNDMTVNEGLMYALYGADDDKYYDEALALGERILLESTDEKQRSSAIQILCFIHDKRGNKEKAKEYAQMASYIHMSREVLLSHISEGEEGTEQNLQLLLDGLDIIERAEYKLCQNSDDERRLQLYEFYLKLLELYFDDGFYGLYSFGAIQRHKLLARLYLFCRNDEQKVSEHLKAAVKYVKQYEGLSTPYVYTSTLLNGYKSHLAVLTNCTETQSELLIHFMNGSDFDSVRDKEWFSSIERELKSAS